MAIKLPPEILQALLGSRRKVQLTLSQELESGEITYRIKRVTNSAEFCVGQKLTREQLTKLLAERPDVTTVVVPW